MNAAGGYIKSEIDVPVDSHLEFAVYKMLNLVDTNP